MSGIYIHIPFCKKACHYCNFHFSTSTALQQNFVDALLKEIELQKEYLNASISTIYFGGGTPSLLTKEQLESIIEKLHDTFEIDEDAEITLESNPDDINKEKLKVWRSLGINRLSIGIQSFFEEDLLWMNRAHNATQAINCIELAQEEGFHNLTIDLIYGTPTLTDEHWKENIQKAIDLNIPHLSCYALTVEPKTALEKLIAKKELENVDADKQAKHFEILMEVMLANGYEHYEISNFAKPGFRSRHNSSYWQGKSYLGLGPSAHSFNGKSRQWNVANNAVYIKEINSDVLPFEVEELTPAQQLNEYIMTSLRTIEGLSINKVKESFGDKQASKLLSASKKYLAAEKLIINNDHLQVTPEGKFLADGIASDLFQL